MWTHRASIGIRLRDGRGLTAVELLIVLAIVAILAFTAYPFLSNVRQVLAVKGAAEQTAAAIRLARQFAITHGSNYCIQFSGSPATTYTIREADSTPACNGTIADGYNSKSISEQDSSVGTSATTLAFDPIGNRILPGGTGSTTFTVDTTPTSCVSTVTVTLYGGIKVSAC